MENKLAYYRSLSVDELISLPMEQYEEYLALMVAASNERFHNDLNQIQSENGSLNSIRTGIAFGTFDVDVAYQSVFEIPVVGKFPICVKALEDAGLLPLLLPERSFLYDSGRMAYLG